MKIIDKTVLNPHEPENTNVMWAEPVEDGVNLRIYNEGEWNTLSGVSYKKPEGGITEEDLSGSVNAKLNAATTAVQSSERGVANGVASLDSDGTIPASQLPAHTYNIVEADTMSQFPARGEAGKIYIDKNTNTLYRWNGSEYISISNPKNVETTPTENSENLITSGGVKTALSTLQSQINDLFEDTVFIGEQVGTVSV